MTDKLKPGELVQGQAVSEHVYVPRRDMLHTGKFVRMVALVETEHGIVFVIDPDTIEKVAN